MSRSVNRRAFLASLGAAAPPRRGLHAQGRVDKRETMLSLLDPGATRDRVPAAFFIHFDERSRLGRAAVDKHVEYFRATGMDFVKIQYERTFPPRAEIKTAADWKAMPKYGLDFYAPQLEAVEGLVKALKKEALVLVTLYSSFMCAGHTTSRETLFRHFEQDPAAVALGMKTITESVLTFVRECVRLGVDGFYASTQGGETTGHAGFFKECVMPADLTVMREINATCRFNILHVCDYEAPYADLSPYVAYPGHIVNCNPKVTTGALAMKDVAKMFGRPVMGGLDRHGTIVTGSPDEIRRAVDDVIDAAPPRFVLGADCTLPGDIAWERIRTAIAAAHARRL
jgi:uroporphyrinogen decarboxylase